MERETMPVDVLFVGAGPANLSAAWHLAQLLQERGRGDDFELMILEKGREVGDHILSGAVMDPRGMVELAGSDWREQGCPVEADVKAEAVYTLKPRRAVKMALIPPPLKNHGNVIVSLSRVVRWMKERVEAAGVMVAEGQPAADLLLEGKRLRGVRLVDRGRDQKGEQGPGFEPGTDVTARITVLGEGSRGSLTRQLVARLGLEGPNPQVYGTGIKELWEVPRGGLPAGTVWHTAGWPLLDHQYGGSWIYAQSDTRLSLGFVVGLDGRDPGLDPYELMQTWKTHPLVADLLQGGNILKCGAKTVPEGGWWSRPKSHGDGFLILGDGASLLNIARLKGIHLAIKSGILAAETIVEALLGENQALEEALEGYAQRIEASWIKEELWRTRNWRQAFAQHGFRAGRYAAGLSYLLGGRLARNRVPIQADHEAMANGQASAERHFQPDGKLTFDKQTGVYHAGSMHEENQPAHLLVADPEICSTRCVEEYGNPCERFCPAAVYEMVDQPPGPPSLRVNASNCVHCKTCDILDPYQIITWTVPEDNGGPHYLGL